MLDPNSPISEAKSSTAPVTSAMLHDSRPSVLRVKQKEYTIAAAAEHQFVGTESVRGCYVLVLASATRCLFAHIDDDTDFAEYDRIITAFLKGGLEEDLKVHLLGGWQDHEISAATGQYLQQCLNKYFDRSQQDDRYFQQKSAGIGFGKFGFALVVYDLNKQQLKCFDDDHQASQAFKFNTISVTEQAWRQEAFDVGLRYFNRRPTPEDEAAAIKRGGLSSGSKLLCIETLSKKRSHDINEIYHTVHNNDVKKLRELLNQTTISVDTTTLERPHTERFLDHAVRYGHYRCAQVLIAHGATYADSTVEQVSPLTPKQLKGLELLKSLYDVYLTKDSEYRPAKVLTLYFRDPKAGPEDQEDIEKMKKFEIMLNDAEQHNGLEKMITAVRELDRSAFSHQ